MIYIILGMIMSVVSLLCFTLLFESFGSILFFLILGGILGYQYGQNKKINERLKKLEVINGIDEEKDYNMTDEEIENELEQYIEIDNKMNNDKP